jgi:single-strand DNA-binding protein
MIDQKQIILTLKFTTMKNLRNTVSLIGNLGADPEVKVFDSGKKKARLSLATSDSYKNASGEKVEDTQWHTLVAWGKTADIAEKYLHKGSELAVEGKLTYRSYEDKSGETKYITEINVNEFVMLGKK